MTDKSAILASQVGGKTWKPFRRERREGVMGRTLAIGIGLALGAAVAAAVL